MQLIKWILNTLILCDMWCAHLFFLHGAWCTSKWGREIALRAPRWFVYSINCPLLQPATKIMLFSTIMISTIQFLAVVDILTLMTGLKNTSLTMMHRFPGTFSSMQPAGMSCYKEPLQNYQILSSALRYFTICYTVQCGIGTVVFSRAMTLGVQLSFKNLLDESSYH